MKKNNWEPETIKAKELEKKIKSGDIQIPSYQRGIVWDKQRKQDLIESIKEGFPFGSLLIYKNENDSKQPQLLIDGLQRSSTLFEFINNPAEFFNENDISEDTLDQLVDLIGVKNSLNGQKETLRNLMISWVKEHNSGDTIRDMNDYECASRIMNAFPTLRDRDDVLKVLPQVVGIINPVFSGYKDLCNSILEADIPYIEISGDESTLPEIFYRINDRGVKLNKQNIFAATWSNKFVTICNEKLYDLVDIVRKRYDDIESHGTKVYGYNSGQFYQQKKLDIFEMTYGFGRYISSKYPHLFEYKDKSTAVESVGFTLLNACLCRSHKELDTMDEGLIDTFNCDADINKFLEDILVCIDYVDKRLAIVTKFKGNKRIGKGVFHSEAQIVSIIASVFILKYVIRSNDDAKFEFNLYRTNREWDTSDRKLRKNILIKYISDIIAGEWSGHGDATLDSIIKNPHIYTSDIAPEAFKYNLLNWHSKVKRDDLSYSAKDVRPPKEADKVLLNVIYANKFSAAKHLDSSKFDIEHLATKKAMEEKLKRFKGELKLPISSFGNICLLPEADNRSKKERTIYSDKEYIDTIVKCDLSIKELEDNYTFTTKTDLDWIYDEALSMKDLEKCYLNFIDKRFNFLCDVIVKSLYDTRNEDHTVIEKELVTV